MYGYSDHALSLDLKELPERFRTISFQTESSGYFG